MTAISSQRLALNLLKELAKDESGNIFYSPLSIANALSMLNCGAAEETASEISEILGSNGSPSKDVQASFHRLLASFDKKTNFYKLECANAAFLQHDFPVKAQYEKTLEKTFKAKIFQEDFTKNKMAVLNRINEWVEMKTNGMIKRLLDSMDSLTGLVLVNVIFFMGTWERQFDKKATSPGTFYNKGTKAGSKKVDMMYQYSRFDYANLISYQILQLPYRDSKIAMMILLPKSLNGLGSMEKSLKPDFIRNLKKEMKDCAVKVSLPKFEIEYFKLLKNTLQQLGMRKAFEESANLSGISDSSELHVTEFMHKAVIKVNEQGTVAAAATTKYLRGSAKNSEFKQDEFIVDHPFLFIIYDAESETIIFAGRIVEL